MNTVKILHTADLHLDCRFSGLSVEKSKIRRQELKNSFADALEAYKDAQVVLICGDIFDNASFMKGTVTFLADVFSSHPDTTFFITMGNHDPYRSRAGEMLKSSMPDNVVIFSDKAEYMELDELGVRVYGMSFSEKSEYEGFMSEFEVIDDDYINILMLHGDLVGKLSDSKYNPVTIEQIEHSGFDYVALGHIHNCDGVHLAGKTYYAYSGTHEPHGFDECGAKGVIYGMVGKGMCRLSLKNTALRSYIDTQIDITSANTAEDVIAMIKEAISDKNSLYRINLVGTARDTVSVDCGLFESMTDAFYIRITDSTHHNYNLDTLSAETGLKGYVAQNVLKELESCNDADVDTVCAASDYLFELMDNGVLR